MRKMTVFLLTVIVCLGTIATIDSLYDWTVHENGFSQDADCEDPSCSEEPIPTPPPPPCDGGGAGGGGGGAPG